MDELLRSNFFVGSFISGVLGAIDPKKNLTAKVHPKYVKCWGAQIKNTRNLILFADDFITTIYLHVNSQSD